MDSIATYGPYKLLKRIATSGVADSFASTMAARDGAEKVLSLQFLHRTVTNDAHFLAALTDEMRLAVRLNHVNVAQVFDFAEHAAQHYVAMEFVDGRPLAQVLEAVAARGEPLPTEVATFISAEICAGLSYAHSRRDERGKPLGLVHCDVRPRNVLVSLRGDVKVAAFGLGRPRMMRAIEDAVAEEGRFHFVAPEIARGEDPTSAADIFSVGAVAYHLLTGRHVYAGESNDEVLNLARGGQIDAEMVDSVPRELLEIVVRALALAPEDRYKTANEFRSALAGWLRRNSPGFGRHRLKSFVDGLLNDATPLLDDASLKTVHRKDFQAKDFASLVHDVDADDGQRDDLSALLFAGAPPAIEPASIPKTAAATEEPPIPKLAPEPPKAAEAASADEHATIVASAPPVALDEATDATEDSDDTGPPTPALPVPSAEPPTSDDDATDDEATDDEPTGAEPDSGAEQDSGDSLDTSSDDDASDDPVAGGAAAESPDEDASDLTDTSDDGGVVFASKDYEAVPDDDDGGSVFDEPSTPEPPPAEEPPAPSPPAVKPAPARQAAADDDGEEEDFATAVYDDSLDPDFAITATAEYGAVSEPAGRTFAKFFAAAAVIVAIGAAIIYVAVLRSTPEDEVPTIGDLFVTSTPQGATILVDGTATGRTTPAPVADLAAGDDVAVSLQFPGFDTPPPQSVEVVGGTTTEVRFELEPSAHTIRVESEPPGATIIYGGEPAGTTPGEIGPLRIDYRQGVDFVVRLEGYFDDPVSVDWNPGESTSTVTRSLEPDPDYVPPQETE